MGKRSNNKIDINKQEQKKEKSDFASFMNSKKEISDPIESGFDFNIEGFKGHNFTIKQMYENLAKIKPNYKPRPNQIKISEMIYNTIMDTPDSEYHTNLIEAPCGSGKTLAYLIALICAKKKAIVSSNTKALQDLMVKEMNLLIIIFVFVNM
jgi:superfamily II DNA/RNA helicase